MSDNGWRRAACGWADFERISVYSDSHQRPAAARAGDRPGGHQSRRRSSRPSPASAAGASCDLFDNDQEIHRQAARQVRRRRARGARAASASRCRKTSTASTRRWSTSAPSRSSRRSQEAGYEAYIVGGAVRDLLVGLRPKDFDVATNATPEQVKALFRRAFIIGRRFRIVHVVFGRGRQDRFGSDRGLDLPRLPRRRRGRAGRAATRRPRASELAGKSHVVDAEGRVLRDNVWGPQIEDAARRDFTVNAMYYDPVREIVVDYHGGIKDAQEEAAAHDRRPGARATARTRCASSAPCASPPSSASRSSRRRARRSRRWPALLDNVPQSRTFDEMIKLLQTGHALASHRRAEEARPAPRRLPGARRRARRGAAPRRPREVRAPRARRHRRARRRGQAGGAELPARLRCSGTTCRTAGSSARPPASRRSRRCRRRSTPPSMRASATSPAAASWPPTCARSG